jgi:single-stranded DNA-binding protein
LAEHVPTTIKKGSHVLTEGTLVSSTSEPANGKSKKSKATKITSWSIRADVVRKLDRGEPEPEATASGSDASGQAPGELSISHWARLVASVIAALSFAKMTFRSRGVHA